MPSKPWEEKKKRIQEKHPEALNVSWDRAIKTDPDLFARIVSDVVKSSSGGSRPGKRPNLAKDEAYGVFSKMIGDDFADQPFQKAFKNLCGQISLRGVAAKTGLGHSYVGKLLNGQAEPTFETMEKIAVGFKKDPSYFLEYRVGYINSAISKYLEDAPETSVSWYLKMKGKKNGSI